MKFSELAQTYERISQAGGEPKRVQLLADLLRDSDRKTVEAVAHLTVGEIVAPQLSDQLGVGPATIRAALAELSGKGTDEIDDAVKHSGDMSEVVASLVRGSGTLAVDTIWQRTNRAVLRNDDRLQVVLYVFAHTTPVGAKYFTRMVLNQMRIGAGFGTLIKAIAAAFDVEAAQVERLYVLTNDIGLAAIRARQGAAALKRTGLMLFRPYQFMNAHKIDSPQEIFTRLKGKQIIFEVKYDGARLQIHIKGGRRRPEVRLYSRRLNDDTAAMPDVVAALQESWTGGD